MINKLAGQFFVLTLVLAICGCAPVTIETIPTGAALYSADGKTQLGTTPYNTSVFVSDKNFTVSKEHYFDDKVRLSFNSPRQIDLKLRAVPVMISSTPNAQIYPSGSETAIGSTPRKMPIYDKDRTYTLKAPDYFDQEITVGSKSPDPIVVKLERRPIVTISATPAGVDVYENNKLIGSAPVKEEILTRRTFELRKPGYFTKVGTLTGAPPYELNVTLRPFPTITITATPSDAQVYRAGKLIGKAPTQLAVGEETVLEVRADRFYPQNVTLTSGSTAQVNVTLKAMPYVKIGSEPTGAEVFIDGKSAGVVPIEKLIEKNTVIEVRKAGFISKTATLTGADKQVTVTLEAVPAPVVPAPVVPAPEVLATPAVQAPEATATNSIPATTSATGSNRNLWIAGFAIIAIALAIFFVIKRKKQ